MGPFDYKYSYRRNLPHIQPAGATFFITFRLAGSLPQSLIDQWQDERRWLARLEQTNPDHYTNVRSDLERKWFAKFESVLDGAREGPLWLKDERIADLLADSFHHRDGEIYRLDAFSIMPNHSHVVFKPLPLNEIADTDTEDVYHSLSAIMQSLKGYTAHESNLLLAREGEFWAHESYDHFIRDYEEWLRIVAYVLNNPVKAGYVDDWRKWKWNYRREL